MIDQLLKKYIPVSYIEGYRLYHEEDVRKMLMEHKELLAANWKLAELEWKPMAPLYPKEETKPGQ